MYHSSEIAEMNTTKCASPFLSFLIIQNIVFLWTLVDQILQSFNCYYFIKFVLLQLVVVLIYTYIKNA